MLYHDRRFANHPRFRYFALNTQMRHQALQTGRIYVRQNPRDHHLTIDELREMVGHGSDGLTNWVLHFGATLHGTWQANNPTYSNGRHSWPATAFFIPSAADLQWPELADLGEDSTARSRAVVENPCMVDWFFYQRVMKFMDVFYRRPRTTGYNLSTNIEVAHTSMVLHGCRMPLMCRVYWLLVIFQCQRSSLATLIKQFVPLILLFFMMVAISLMLRHHRSIRTSVHL